MQAINNFNISDLNTGQKEAFELFKEFLTSRDGSMFCLRGYAGTGKTYLVKRLIKYIHTKYPGFKIAVTAPTNKAVKVLAKTSSIKDLRVTYQTVHKLLGLKEDIQLDGTIKFIKNNMESNDIDKFKILIVDEVSMLDDTLFTEIQSYSKRLKIIFMGDPAQIPPVNKTDCIPFNDEKKIFYDFREYTLTEIMRQSLDNPIIASSFLIRNNLTKRFPIEDIQTTLNNKGHGIVRINANNPEERDSVMGLFEKYFKCPQFENNPDYAKVIAWRNVTINKTNQIIRGILYGPNPGKIMVGEKLVCNKPITDGLNIIMFNTNDEFSVEEFNIATDLFDVDGTKTRLSYYDTKVLAIDLEGKEYKRMIKILHEDSLNDFAKVSKSLMENAKALKGAHRSWLKYYEFLREFADVGYNYAITAHKAQGSTYKNVFIIEDDIDYNSNLYEKNRIKYTAYSRAAEVLFILKR